MSNNNQSIKNTNPNKQKNASSISPVADSTEADIKALLAQDETDTITSQPTDASQTNEEDEFERLLNEFINAELDEAKEDAQENLENVKNGQAQESATSLPISNTDEENSNLLQDPEKSLYRAYQNYFFAIRMIAESNNLSAISPSLTAENFYPHYKPRIGIRISKEIMQGWDIMLKVYPQDLASLNPSGTDDELLDFAEQANDENLQLAVISYVEILIEMEGCDIQYETRKLKAERRKIEKEIYEAHQARVEKSQKYIEAIRECVMEVDKLRDIEKITGISKTMVGRKLNNEK